MSGCLGLYSLNTIYDQKVIVIGVKFFELRPLFVFSVLSPEAASAPFELCFFIILHCTLQLCLVYSDQRTCAISVNKALTKYFGETFCINTKYTKVLENCI